MKVLQTSAQQGTQTGGESQYGFADFNGDGKIDVVYLAEGGAVVFFGNGDGTFRRDVGLSGPGGQSCWELAAAGFNGDGKADVFMQCGVIGDLLYLGNGDGSFQPAIQFSDPVKVSTVLLAADLTGGGSMDLFIGGIKAAYPSGPSILTLKNNGSGTFSVGTKSQQGWVEAAAIADLNGDHIPDIVVALANNNIVSFLGKGAGNLELPGLSSPMIPGDECARVGGLQWRRETRRDGVRDHLPRRWCF